MKKLVEQAIIEVKSSKNSMNKLIKLKKETKLSYI
jgi:hypothetical protein